MRRWNRFATKLRYSAYRQRLIVLKAYCECAESRRWVSWIEGDYHYTTESLADPCIREAFLDAAREFIERAL